MPSSTDDAALAADYLLGRLAEEERERVDERLFADDEFFVLIRACEEELIRDHLKGRLSLEDDMLFRRKYLGTAPFREKVKLTSAIMNAVERRSPPAMIERRWWWSLAVACLAVAALGLGLFLNELRTSRLDRQLVSVEESQAQLKASIAGRRVLSSFVLAPGLRREGTEHARVLIIPPGEGQVEFQFQVSPGTAVKRYRVAIATVEGSEVWSSIVPGDRSDDRAIAISVPARVFHRADYVATLDDADAGPSHESYAFRAEH
jgi:hypothetical protein